MPTSELYELLDEMMNNNIKLLDEDDEYFISKGASESQMLKMKHEKQLLYDKSTTTLETNADSTSYIMSIQIN